MKTKFKEFVKKIINWLSSLCKWAKNHSLKLFVLLIDILFLLGFVFSCHVDNKKSASASTIQSNTAFIVTPTVSSKTTINNLFYTVDLMPFYITYRNTSNSYSIAVPRAVSPTSGLVYRDVYLTFDNGVYTSNFEFVLSSLTSNGSTQFISLNSSVELISYSNYDYIINNGYNCNCIVDNGNCYFNFYDNSNNALLSVKFYDLNFDTTFNVSNFSAFNIVIGGSVDGVAVSNAYNDGYLNGYNNGYNNGLNETLGSISPWNTLTNAVTEFLDIKLFGDVSLNVVLYIAFGMLAFTLIVKMLR